MNNSMKLLAGIAIAVAATQVSAQVRIFENDNFRGRSFTADRAVDDFARTGFNDRASSVIVRSGAWEFCSDAHFNGSCVVLRPGRYPSLRAMNLNDKVSSIRRARGGRRP